MRREGANVIVDPDTHENLAEVELESSFISGGFAIIGPLGRRVDVIYQCFCLEGTGPNFAPALDSEVNYNNLCRAVRAHSRQRPRPLGQKQLATRKAYRETRQ
ncbi:hypothetical protein KC345_g178 [Hortaea werneckii]|nr:hypothetical protein KC345_g178 [Hortaea werneckii]